MQELKKRSKRVVLVFRDPLRNGKSVEEIYNGLVVEFLKEFEVQIYYYKDQQSIYKNVSSIYRLKPDIVHITSDIYFLAIFLFPINVILTIHDIGRYRSLKGIKKVLYKWLYFSLPGLISKAIVVVSSFSRSELSSIYSDTIMKKVSVIYNPISPVFKAHPKRGLHGIPVILQVGTSEHKNLDVVIKAMTGLNCKLNIVGRLSDAQSELLNSAHIPFSHYEDLSYTQVVEQYQNADLVTFVSRYEGFGMPVIEAQAVGRPIITSTLTSLPEIAGDGAYFISDIYNSAKIREAILTILKDHEVREQLVAKGSENVKRFRREEIAQQYINLYTSVGS